MKITKIIQASLAASIVIITGCGGSQSGLAVSENLTPESSINDTSVTNSVSSGMDAVALSLQPDNSGVVSVSAVSTAALRSGSEVEDTAEHAAEVEHEHEVELEIERHRGIMHAPRICSDSDASLPRTVSCDDTTHVAIISRDFSECSSENDSGVGVSVTGKTATVWNHMGNTSCPAADQKPSFWQAVQGQGLDLATQVFTTDPLNPTDPQVGLTRENGRGASIIAKGYALNTYSNAAVTDAEKSVHQQVSIPSFSRIRYKHDGVTKLFDHTISTETPLEIDLAKSGDNLPTRTIVSGTLAVSHNLAKFTTHTSFTNVKYDYNECECHPVSGSVSINVTDNDTHESIGSGTVTFSNCVTASIDYQGRTIPLPELDSCR